MLGLEDASKVRIMSECRAVRTQRRATRKWLRILYIGLPLAFLFGGIILFANGCSVLLHRRSILKSLREPQCFGASRLEVHGNVPVLHLYGSPQEMGRQHGALLRDALSSLDRYVHALLPEKDSKRLLAFAERAEPHLPKAVRTELKAMAEAAGVPYLDLVAFNATPRLRCSALAVWGEATSDGGLIMGRNADYFSMGLADRGGVMVVYHPKQGKAVLSVTYLGMIGAFTGVNEDGVAFGNMLVFNAADNRAREDGLPVQLAFRLAAHESASAEAMCRRLRERKHMIPMNAMIADKSEALVLELGHGGSHVWSGEKDSLAVSNYFRSDKLRDYRARCKRYQALRQAAASSHGRFGVAEMQRALYQARMEKINLQAVVFEPAKARLHVSMNRVPASKGPYRTFDLKALFDARPSN